MMHTEVKIFWKKFCESLREHTMEIINFKKKKKMLLTEEEHESYENVKSIKFAENNLKINMLKIRKTKIVHLGTTVIIQINLELMHTAYAI